MSIGNEEESMEVRVWAEFKEDFQGSGLMVSSSEFGNTV